MVFLLDLASELIFEIVQHLDQQRDIKSLAYISVKYYNTFIDDVYHFNISSRGGRGVLWAIRHDQASTVAKFIKLGLDVNATPGLDGSSLLHTAAYHASLSTVKFLLQKGADINARTMSGTTPLSNALENWHEQVTYSLSRHIPDMSKAFVNVARGLTPLHAACQFKFANAAKLFLELGADLCAKDAEGMTPLYHALSCHTFGCRRVDGDAVFRTLTVLVEFGATQDLQAMESPPNCPSTFHLGYNHEDRRVRQLLFYRKKDNTAVMGRAYRISRAWIFEEIEQYEL
jgi:hypothetical protein